MGSLFSCKLSSVAHVIMVGTWAEQLAEINSNGLLIQHPEGNWTRHTFTATNRLETVGQSDVVLVLVKSWQTERAAYQASQILSDYGIAVTLQNGLDNLRILSDVIGDHRAIQGVSSEGAMMIEPGKVKHAGRGLTHIAVKDGSRELISDLFHLIREAGFKSELVESAESLVWGKLAVNAGINPLTALLQVRNGTLPAHSATREIMCQAASETASVAQALEIPLPYKSASARVLEVAMATAENRSSMAQDIARSMPSEIDAINGAIVRIGQQYGVNTPVNKILFKLIKSQVAKGEWLSQISDIPEPWQAKFKASLVLMDTA